MARTNSIRCRFSDPVARILLADGWQSGRRILLPEKIEKIEGLFPAARNIFEEFGGLTVGKCGTGIDMAKGDMAIDPLAGLHLRPTFDREARKVGAEIFPLGEIYAETGFILVDSRRRIYIYGDELEAFAPSFDLALESILLGKKIPQDTLAKSWLE